MPPNYSLPLHSLEVGQLLICGEGGGWYLSSLMPNLTFARWW